MGAVPIDQLRGIGTNTEQNGAYFGINTEMDYIRRDPLMPASDASRKLLSQSRNRIAREKVAPMQRPCGDSVAQPDCYSADCSSLDALVWADVLVLPGARPARLSASRRIHSTWALALRISSAAQRSTAAHTSGSIRNGYCFLAVASTSPAAHTAHRPPRRRRASCFYW